MVPLMPRITNDRQEMRSYDDDEEVFCTALRVLLDDVTIARLAEVAEGCHAPIAVVAAAIIRDVMDDDYSAHCDATDNHATNH
jgi:hypothetical protein